jgi:replicative DNA helicase Mcm
MGSLAGRWRSYFATECQSDVEEVTPNDSSGGAVTIDLIELHGADQDLARAALERPDPVLAEARSVLRELTDASAPIQLRIENNPHLCGVSDVSARQFHDLVTVRGVVEAVDPVRASTVSAQYTCPACGASIRTSSTGIEHEEPIRCDGCEWDGHFEFHPAESAFVDTQRLTLAPTAEQREERPRSESLPVYVHGDLVAETAEGDHVGITGILRVRRRSEPPLYTPYLDGLGIRDERDISPPETLEAALDSYWDQTTSSPASDG